MRARLILGWTLILSLMAAIGYAQQPTPAAPAAPATRLSLAEALDIARRSNPILRQAQNDRWVASNSARSARLNLLTPDVSVSSSINMSAAGTQRDFFGDSQNRPSSRYSTQSFGLSYRLAGSTFTDVGLARANLEATEADITGSTIAIETGVRRQYLQVLQTKAQEALARQSLERSRENFNLAQARMQVGQGTLIDVRQAEVARGQAEVGVLRAERNVINEVLVLYQQLGIPAPPGAAVMLTDSFPVVAPAWSQEQLVTQALAENPTLRALRARETSANWAVRSARSQYLPSLNASAGVSRSSSYQGSFTVMDTSGTPITIPARSTPSQTNPWGLSISISLPIYDGFQRSVQTANARAQREDIVLAIRSRELGVRAEVTAAYSTLDIAYRTIAIQDANRTASTEALDLATQRYRVGSGTYIELLSARVAAEQAAADYVTAVYEYHRSIAALENAVGRTLR